MRVKKKIKKLEKLN